jgi:hypothetical protein
MSKQKRKSENNDDDEEVKRLKIDNDQFKDELKQTKEGKNKKQDKHNENKCDECGDKQSEWCVLKDGKCEACIFFSQDISPSYIKSECAKIAKQIESGNLFAGNQQSTQSAAQSAAQTNVEDNDDIADSIDEYRKNYEANFKKDPEYISYCQQMDATLNGAFN